MGSMGELAWCRLGVCLLWLTEAWSAAWDGDGTLHEMSAWEARRGLFDVPRGCPLGSSVCMGVGCHASKHVVACSRDQA